MRQAQIDNYTNPRPSGNTSYTTACVVAKRYNDAYILRAICGLWGTRAVNVVAIPRSKDLELCEEPFTPEMVLPGGFLFDVHLNHHIIIERRGGGGVGVMNAGSLAILMLFSMLDALGSVREIFNAPTTTEDCPPAEADCGI